MSKRAEIIQLTQKLIRKNGYQATTINDVLKNAKIGKGQFYHYFSSKHELGLAVVNDLVEEWKHQLVFNVLQSSKKPKEKFSEMLDWIVYFHSQSHSGCPYGNLALEMSEHDEKFRICIDGLFHLWIDVVKNVLDEMVQNGDFNVEIENDKYAQSIVATIEGAILLKKSGRDIQILKNIMDVLRIQLQLGT